MSDLQPPQDFWVLAAKNSESVGLLVLAYVAKQIIPIFAFELH